MTRLYGRALVGERCRARVPYCHWQSATFIAALRHDRISAPWLIDGPMDGTLFLTYVERVLCPELQPDDLVVCDNLSSHKVCGVAEVIAARGAHLQYLPIMSCGFARGITFGSIAGRWSRQDKCIPQWSCGTRGKLFQCAFLEFVERWRP